MAMAVSHWRSAALHVKGDRIAWVGRAADLPEDAQNAKQVDASGKWLLPGLIDAHIHISLHGTESVFALLEKHRDDLVLEAVDICERVLSHGVTTIRDVAARNSSRCRCATPSTEASSADRA